MFSNILNAKRLRFSFFDEANIIINFDMSQSTQYWSCCRDDRIFPSPYSFIFGKEGQQKNKLIFESNYVRTSKYRWYTFIPKALILQFQRLANIYFLAIAIMQTIPAISPLGPLTAWSPLIVVLGISMLREGYQDYQRYASDRRLNHDLKTQVLREKRFVEVEWSQVIVGDIVLVKEDQKFPADLILLSSNTTNGNAFIETASLDGEKSLKPRSAYPQTQRFSVPETFAHFKGSLDASQPKAGLQQFGATLSIDGLQQIAYSKQKQFLYRQAVLKNTEWIYGLTIYTGRNTKIMLNSGLAQSKMSQVQVKVNYILVFILLFEVILCAILGGLDGGFVSNKRSVHSYILWGDYSAVGDGFLMFCTYLVLLNTMIPISLVVTIEMTKICQAYFINHDQMMYSQWRRRGAQVNSSTLNEEIGQIQYVFSDKTGTLTCNLMQFKIALIGHRLFGDLGLIDKQTPVQSTKGFSDQRLLKILQRKSQGNQIIKNFVAKNREGTQKFELNNLKQLAQQYFLALSLTHEVLAQPTDNGTIKYQGPSPDQIALVQTAKIMGYQFVQSGRNFTKVNINGQIKSFELLQSFAFTSDRKRMSVIIRHNDKIFLYSKGADNIIKSRLAKNQTFDLDNELSIFSRIGLRTLLIAMRLISEEQYSNYKRKELTIPKDQQSQKQALISDLQTGLYVIGATAVLDRLQDQVPETIRDLIRANIKVWMLTGDKLETAENIAKSCNLFQPDFSIHQYVCNDREDSKAIGNELDNMLNKIEKQAKDSQIGLLIEGPDLPPILRDNDLSNKLAKISLLCNSVVCCRLLPGEKAGIVKMVREQLGKITLAIGDGANDVPMIKAAHIGIGLFGEQGMGAVQSSDYALPQFRMLWRLLFVHGRWNYMRIAEMILYFFYKNMLFTIPQFIFAFFCAYSGQTIFDDIYISLYNLIFTAFPLAVRAVFEQDVYYIRPRKEAGIDASVSAAEGIRSHVLGLSQSKYLPANYQINKYIYRLYPKLYFVGQQNCIFNYKNFFLWAAQGIIQAILLSLFSIYILSQSALSLSGYSSDMWIVSITIYTTVMMLVTFKLSTHSKIWSLLLLFIILLSLGLYVAYMWISNYYFSDYVTGNTFMFFTSGQTYFIVLFCVCFVLAVDGIVLAFDSQHADIVSKLRRIVSKEKDDDLANYEKKSIKFSVQTIVPES